MIQSDCQYFNRRTCRSCQWIDQPYAIQLANKQKQAEQMLAALAPSKAIEWYAPVASAVAHFRNKAKMVVGGSSDQPSLGLVDPHTDVAVDLTDCLLYPPEIQQAFAPIKQFIRDAQIPPYQIVARRGELKYVLLSVHDDANQAPSLMLRLVLRSREAESRIRKSLANLLSQLPLLRVVSINVQAEPKAIVEGALEIVLTAANQVIQRFGDVPLALRPKSFFQTNTAVTAKLYQQAQAWIHAKSPAVIWDLYCGVGGFALHAAASATSVHGVEISAEAIASAKASADSLAYQHVQFSVGDALAYAKAQQTAPNLVIVNPPRRGIGTELSAWLEHSNVETLLYSSCNIESMAQDFQRMPSFRITRAQVFDMFAHTGHFETLVIAERC
jgi:23S rRNA (uracil747-C5)-methyltransferase